MATTNVRQVLYKGKKLSANDVKYLKGIKPNEITLSLLESFFAYTKDKDPRFDPSDTFMLESDEYLHNKGRMETTVGRFIFNKFIFEGTTYEKYFTYNNDRMDKKAINKLQNSVMGLFLEDKITAEEVSDYFDKMTWISFATAKFINPSLNSEMLKTPESVKKRKEELRIQYEKDIENKNLSTIKKMEDELLEMGKNEIKDLASTQIYDSGSRATYGNNYKNTAIMRGAVSAMSGDPKDAIVSLNSLDDGIKPEEMHSYANILTQAFYSKAIQTREGGYASKKMSASFQTSFLGEKGSDCHSTRYLEIYLTDSNFGLFKFRYLLDNGKLIMLTNENKSKYLNKVVQFRSPIYCLDDHICNKCAGELFYMIGIKNIGLLTNEIGGNLSEKSMKAFHDSTVKLASLDVNDYIEAIKIGD